MPRAVVGLTEISARKAVRNVLGNDNLTFFIPYCLYKEMESDALGRFLQLDLWNEFRDSA